MKTGQQQLVFLNGLFLALLLGIYGADWLCISSGWLALGMAGFFFLSLVLLVRESSRSWLAFLLLFLFFGAWRFAWGEALPADDASQLIGARRSAAGARDGARDVRALYGGGEARAPLRRGAGGVGGALHLGDA